MSPTLTLPKAAAALEAHGEPELAAEVRAFHDGEAVDGHTPHNIALARLWCRIDDRIKAGADRGRFGAMWPRDKTKRVGHLEYILAADIVLNVCREHSAPLRVSAIIASTDDSGLLSVSKVES